MNSSVASDKLFQAISQANVEEVQSYLDQKGSLEVVSSRGYPPLVDVAMAIVTQRQNDLMEDMDEDEEGELTALVSPPQTAATTPTTLSDGMQALCDIGVKLIEHGARYDVRAGRTNRSIKLSEMMTSRFPDIHRQWDASFCKAVIMSNVSEDVDLSSKKTSPQRKI